MLSVVVSYLRVCLKGRGPGPSRPPEPELGLSRWKLNGPSLGTAKAKHPDSQGPASGGAVPFPVLPMAGQASPHPHGSKDMARKVRPPAPLPPDLAQRWAVWECLQAEMGLPTHPGAGSLGSVSSPGPSGGLCGPWCTWGLSRVPIWSLGS